MMEGKKERMHMEIKKINSPIMDVNTYLIIDGGKCLIVDPSFSEKEIVKTIETMNLKPVGMILTHTHYDHLISVNALYERYQIPLYVHELEVDHLYDKMKNLSGYFLRTQSYTVNPEVPVIKIDEGAREIEGMQLIIYHIPGHSIGSITLYFASLNEVIVGDCLFHRSIGRTDFPEGNYKQLISGIKTKLFSLPDDTVVHPGHGRDTTIGDEKQHNPFLI